MGQCLPLLVKCEPVVHLKKHHALNIVTRAINILQNIITLQNISLNTDLRFARPKIVGGAKRRSDENHVKTLYRPLCILQ
jgi:hypothetical protein